MRLYLQIQPDQAEPVRFYQLSLEQDLLGGWTLYREWGIQGGRASLKREQFLSHTEALTAFAKHRDAQLKRGFRVMFSQGADASGR
ncbi:WGR domain-containing protein [Frateuria aurantia]